MRKAQVIVAAPIDWYRIPVDKETLREFTQKSDLKGWLQAGSFLLIFIITTGLALYFFLRRWWVPMVAVCYLHSLFQQMIGMSAAVHELSHGTPLKSKPLNELFYHVFCFLTWNNPVHFRASHMLHHQFTAYRGRDKEVILEPVRVLMNWSNYVAWFTFDYTWFWTLVTTTVLHAFGNADADFFSWDPLFEKGDPRRAAMCGWAWFMLISAVLLIGVFAFFHLWVLIYLIVFGGFFATVIGRLTGAIQHQGLSPDTPDWRLVAHTVEVNPLVRFLYWNMNFHIDHHMYAAVPFHQLPKFHEILKKDLPECPKSFSAGITLVLSIKKRQEAEPEFIYVPKFPPGAAPPRLAAR
jgi:fatty acid desaturase